MHFSFIKYRRVFYIISMILALASIASIAFFGLNLGIEFSGGSLLEVVYQQTPPDAGQIRQALAGLNLGNIVLQKAGQQGIIIKTRQVDQAFYQQMLDKLKELGPIEEGSASFQLIGPVIGQELKKKTTWVVSFSLLAIILYIALSFRRVSRPVRSYIYSFTSLIALFHDVLLPLGVFALLGRFLAVEITIPIITAFLTVFGYSINDSVVIFDRIRENLIKGSLSSFDSAVEQSLNQSLKRSLHTSLTTLIALFAIFLLGGESLRWFSLALILGIACGTYSSIFLAAPLLASFLNIKERKYST